MDWTYRNETEIEIELPLPFLALREALSSRVHEHVADMAERYREKYADRIFPNGPGSAKILHNNYTAVFPNVIARSDDGYWDTYYPSERKSSDLPGNGFVTYGKAGGTVLMSLRKPDDVSLETFTSDPVTFMDLVLKGISITRDIGKESVRITSLGPAARDEIHTDAYDRHWQLRTWNLPYEDRVLVTLSLPAPGGNVTMMKVARTGDAPEYIHDLKTLSDFLYLSYYGTLADWHEFLALERLLPAAFSDIGIDVEYGERVRYRSDRLAFEIDTGLMDITRDSDIKLGFSYFKEDGAVIWDVAEVMVGEDKDNSVFYDVERATRPAASMDDKHKTSWNKIVRRDFPFNGEPFSNDDSTYIASVYTDGLPVGRLSEAPHLYTVHYNVEGNADDDLMRDRLAEFAGRLTIHSVADQDNRLTKSRN